MHLLKPKRTSNHWAAQPRLGVSGIRMLYTPSSDNFPALHARGPVDASKQAQWTVRPKSTCVSHSLPMAHEELPCSRSRGTMRELVFGYKHDAQMLPNTTALPAIGRGEHASHPGGAARVCADLSTSIDCQSPAETFVNLRGRYSKSPK